MDLDKIQSFLNYYNSQQATGLQTQYGNNRSSPKLDSATTHNKLNLESIFQGDVADQANVGASSIAQKVRGLVESILLNGNVKIEDSKPKYELRAYPSSREQAQEQLTTKIDQYVSDPSRAAKYLGVLDEVFSAFDERTSSQQIGFENESAPTVENNVSQALGRIGINRETAVQLTQTALNWKNLTDASRLEHSGNLGLSILNQLGVINDQQLTTFRDLSGALAALANRNESNTGRAIALANAVGSFVTPRYSGSLESPQSIDGVGVVGSAASNEGEQGYLLSDGRIIARKDLTRTHNTASILNAVSLLSSDASDKEKAIGLAQLGINSAQANQILSSSNANQLGTVLSVANTAAHWSDMSDGERVINTVQIANSTMNSLGVTSGSYGGYIQTAQAAYNLYKIGSSNMTAEQKAHATIDTVGLAVADAYTFGAASVFYGFASKQWGGTMRKMQKIQEKYDLGFKALAGAFKVIGGGKNEDQVARDLFRNQFESFGLAFKPDGSKSHHIELADGTLYDIGRDGRASFTGVDGSQVKYGYESDWSNPLTPEAAGLILPFFQIATGGSLGPTGAEGQKGSNVVAQFINGVVSNAGSDRQIMLANIRKLYSSAGITYEQASKGLEALKQAEKISPQDLLAFQNGLRTTFETGAGA